MQTQTTNYATMNQIGGSIFRDPTLNDKAKLQQLGEHMGWTTPTTTTAPRNVQQPAAPITRSNIASARRAAKAPTARARTARKAATATAPKKLTAIQQKVFNQIPLGGGQIAQNLIKVQGVKPGTIGTTLLALKKAGYLVQQGEAWVRAGSGAQQAA